MSSGNDRYLNAFVVVHGVGRKRRRWSAERAMVIGWLGTSAIMQESQRRSGNASQTTLG
jgi:hypothetical protein